jgi:hypothetical protein
VPRQERVAPPGDDDRDRDEGRVDRLGHEEVRRALDVRDDPTAFADDAGQSREEESFEPIRPGATASGDDVGRRPGPKTHPGMFGRGR